MVKTNPFRIIDHLVGFPLQDSYKYRVSNRKYRLGDLDIETLKSAVQIFDCVKGRRSLFRLRARIHAIRKMNCRGVLSHLITTTSHRTLRLIAIWLRGLCGGNVGVEIVAACAMDPNVRIRAAATRALKQLSAWSELRKIAENDPSERIRNLASQRPRRDFLSRMHKFLRNTAEVAVEPSQRGLITAPQFQLQLPRRFKSGALIRQILLRIRQLVHGKHA